MHDARDMLETWAEGLLKTLRVARAMVQAGRTVELDGLGNQVGLLCAKVIDLAPHDGRAFRPRMAMILVEVDAIAAALAGAAITNGRPGDPGKARALLS